MSSQHALGVFERLEGSWSGQWNMPSWTCIEPDGVRVSASGQQAFGLCCVDSLANPITSLMTLSFFKWSGGQLAMEMRRRTEAFHIFENGMLVSQGLAHTASYHRAVKAQGGSFSFSCRADEVLTPVQCCNDVKLPGWKTDCGSLWYSNVTDCHELPYAHAVEYCSDLGGRLCKENELADNCVQMPVCGSQERLAWAEDSCISKIPCATDFLPSLGDEHPTCMVQKVNTLKCEDRRSGKLNDGYCNRTCEMCGPCEDVADFKDEWGGKNTVNPAWQGTCSEWKGSNCAMAVEWYGYSQQGEDDILANCKASCGLCPGQDIPQDNAVFVIQDITPLLGGEKIKAINAAGLTVCLYIESDQSSLMVSVRSRSEIYDRLWHEAYDCSDELFTSFAGVAGCDPGDIWPRNWKEVYAGLVDGTMNMSAANALMSSYRRSEAKLQPSRRTTSTTTPRIASTDGITSASTRSTEGIEWIILVIVLSIVSLSMLGVLAYCLIRKKKPLQSAEPKASVEGGPVVIEDCAPNTHLDSLSQPDESDFSLSNVANILQLGISEHWFIPPEKITFSDRLLGRGGFGMVLAGKIYGDTLVAVKISKRGLDTDPAHSMKYASSIANEMKLFRRIRHPNIVLYHGATVYKQSEELCLCLVLELVQGCDFRMFLNTRMKDDTFCHTSTLACLPEQKLLHDISLGMQFLHEQDPVILHRDLKPANILVETEIAPPRAKLTDFGLAVLLQDGDMSSKAGTNRFMAPEVEARKTYGAPADVYSFGCVCEEAVRAVLAFGKPGSSSPDEERKIIDGSNIPRHLETILKARDGCLHHDPAHRMTFSELLRLLGTADSKEQGKQHLIDISTTVGTSSTRRMQS